MNLKKLFVISALVGSSSVIAEATTPSSPSHNMNNRGMTQYDRTMLKSDQSNWTRNFSRTEVKNVQKELSQEGFYTGKIDGIVGRKTKSALTDFQTINDLQVTGTINQETLRAMGIERGDATYSE